MVSAEEVRRWLGTFDPGDDRRARRSRDAVVALIASASDPTSRTHFVPGHLTASGLVLSNDCEAVLLVYHARLGRWLQPGGHLEPEDGSLVDAARREVREETGIEVEGTSPLLAAVDVHEIPAARGEPPHRHHDFMFRFVSARHVPTPGPGALRAAWCPVSDLDAYGVDAPLRGAIARALASGG